MSVEVDWYEQFVYLQYFFGEVVFFDFFGIDVDEFDFDVVGDVVVEQCFVEVFVGVGQFDVFVDDVDVYCVVWVFDLCDEVLLC